MGKRANIRDTRIATETAVWQKQADELRQHGLIPQTAGPREAQKFSQAAANHHGRFGVMWLWFGIIALPAFGVIGIGAMWFLAPLGILFATIHGCSAAAAASMTVAERTRRIYEKQVWGTAQWTGAQCSWCGSVIQHRDEAGRLTASQSFHADEIAAAVDRRVIADHGVDGRPDSGVTDGQRLAQKIALVGAVALLVFGVVAIVGVANSSSANSDARAAVCAYYTENAAGNPLDVLGTTEGPVQEPSDVVDIVREDCPQHINQIQAPRPTVVGIY